MSLEDFIMRLLFGPDCRWCPVCKKGRPLAPGAIVIECFYCGVDTHCDNWLVKKPIEKERPNAV